ncbi:MAG TPA: transcription-repair coupling factor [Prolixibacteraceae bacterium]|nr:transcription-repair coupling factor [Prolixibacteraceae bacterium]
MLTSEQIYRSHPLFPLADRLLAKRPVHLHVKGLAGSSPALFLSAIISKRSESLLLVWNDREEAAYFFDDLGLAPFQQQLLFFPSSFKRSAQHGMIDQEHILRRTEVLNRISEGKRCIVVTYPEALVEPVISKEGLKRSTLRIAVADKLSIEFIVDVLHEYGFSRSDFAYEPGQYSVRGGIIDIFSFSHNEPYRIDFFGDEIESIRSFTIETQLSHKSFDSINIIPDIQQGMSEEKRIDFFSCLPENFLLVFQDLTFTREQMKHIAGRMQVTEGKDAIAPTGNLDDGSGIPGKLVSYSTLELGSLPAMQDFVELNFSTSPQPSFNKNFELLAQELKMNCSNGYENYILTTNDKQIERLKAIFDDRALNVPFTPLSYTIHEGFADRDLKKAFYTDHQIFERYHRYSLQTSGAARETLSLNELNKLHPGDYVVHIDHGIGRFAGLVKTEINGRIQEAIRLVYRDNDSLLVNVQSLHRISKYKGKDGTEPVIHKLGTGAWQKIKSRAKSKVKDIARELIALYAERLKEQGFSFSPDSFLQQELEASFLYEDTPDQVKATQDIKRDMERAMPMDRLVCGDVGFGKTEVAIRAAFKAATDNKQVAVLVPTTILALQHYKTFSERLEPFPVSIGYVSRLRSSAEIRQTLNELSAGKIDILIGTHRLLGGDVQFKDLGLLIVDEEQKFGVSAKEKLKKRKVNVDTLSLTATPIPRTLQFSLMGARDLSVIQTPPPNRYPIVTEVHGFNEAIIKQAIDHELNRAGQVFFIHNRVQNIYEVETFIRKACPDARVIVGHGQMEGAKLEKVMLDFINGRYDVLIATTIIENGLDIPNANTIIINHAHTFGLSDLHQLRGRVGRSNKKAFCYLLAPPLSSLAPEARRRLKAIEEFSELGSGFNIAMRDLDIRGAGNLLGAEQSGFIAEIGYEAYHRILNEAVLELKQDEFKDLFTQQQAGTSASKAFLNLNELSDCSIETDLELRFPESYINSTTERMNLYRELDNVGNEEELQKFAFQLNDRFGPIPGPASDLLEAVRLRWTAIELGLERIVLKNGKMIGQFISNEQSVFFQSETFARILSLIQQKRELCRMKEDKNKLTMVFDKVKTITKAHELLKNFQ